jgi:cytochrome c oxidase subunit 2
MWRWTPILRLKEGVTYTLHLSSLDLNHGFNLLPGNINIQVVPGYDYALKIVPHTPGEYTILCNEFCGIGHHLMVGKVYVTPQTTTSSLDLSVRERRVP